MVFHLGPLAPRPSSATSTPRRRRQRPARSPDRTPPPTRTAVRAARGHHDPAGGGHRHRRRRPGRRRRAGLLGPAHRRPHRDPWHHPLRPGGLPLPDRRRVRLRPARPTDSTPEQIGARRPLRPVRAGRRPGRRCGTPASTPASEDPWRVGVSLGTAVGGTTRLEHDYVAGQRAAASRWDVDHRAGRPAPAPGVLAQHARLGGRRAVRRARPGADRLHRLHLRPRRGRLRLPHHRGGPGRRLHRRRLGLADLPDHGGLLRRDQGHLARTTTTPRTPPARSTPTATASSWARAAPCWSWRSWNTPGPAARTSTARSAATPPSATPTT